VCNNAFLQFCDVVQVAIHSKILDRNPGVNVVQFSNMKWVLDSPRLFAFMALEVSAQSRRLCNNFFLQIYNVVLQKEIFHTEEIQKLNLWQIFYSSSQVAGKPWRCSSRL
jgi:hypothetical protein